MCDGSMKRVQIVTGHYGSGKTEFAVNLALRLSRTMRPLTLVDLDIVNPYFRSAERRQLLESHGVSVLASSCDGIADLPALPAALMRVWEDETVNAILDIGGDAIGARVLARFAPYLETTPHDLLFVLNANRPETRTADAAIQYLRSVEESSLQRVTGLVNNTHLCRETTQADIEKGAALAHAVSERTGVPVLWHVAEERFVNGLDIKGEGALLPIRITMTKPWESMEEDVWQDW